MSISAEFEANGGTVQSAKKADDQPYDKELNFFNLYDYKSVKDAKRKRDYIKSLGTGGFFNWTTDKADKYILEQEKKEQEELGEKLYQEQADRIAPFIAAGTDSNAAFNEMIKDPIGSKEKFSDEFINSEHGQRILDAGNANAASQLEAMGMLGGTGAFKQMASVPQQMADNAYAQRRQDLTYGIGNAMSALGLQAQASGGYQNMAGNLYNQSRAQDMQRQQFAHQQYLQELAGTQRQRAMNLANKNQFAHQMAGIGGKIIGGI